MAYPVNSTNPDRPRGYREAWWLVLLLAVAAALPASLSGCVSQRAGLEIPAQAYVVGGGLLIEYRATEDGLLFLVDQRQLVASRTIDAGEIFRVNGSVEIGDGSTVELLESRLYFLPYRLLAPPDASTPGRGAGSGSGSLPRNSNLFDDDADADGDAPVEDEPTLEELEDALGRKANQPSQPPPAIADVPTTPPPTLPEPAK